jgi:hypothetical protein
MADAVTSQVLVDGPRNAVMKFTNLSDGTGESAVLKVDVSTLSGAPTTVRIDKIIASTSGMAVSILWDATTDVPAFIVGQDSAGEYCFDQFGGLRNNAGSGVTGDVMFTTHGHTAGDSYTVILEMSKS